MKQAVERRLAAILAADVAGYSRLMGADEEETHGRLKAHRRELIDPKIDEHSGRLCHGNSAEQASKAKSGHASCGCDRIAPLCGSFGSEDPQCGSGDEVALKVEGVVNRTVKA